MSRRGRAAYRAIVLVALVGLTGPVLAQSGGTGGGNVIGGSNVGGIGGTSNATTAGGNGVSGQTNTAGGGGGGAGTTGGSGGTSQNGAAGGAGGVSSINGGNGVDGANADGNTTFNGGGGGGGAHGLVLTAPSTVSNGVAGGNGGNGGNGTGDAGGGGGAGGYGAVVENGANATANASISGGSGGSGGVSQNPFGANGGDGGIGLATTGASAITNSSTITGGSGGSGGQNVGCCSTSTFTLLGGTGGNGGAAISLTSGATLTNSGTLTGGHGGNGGSDGATPTTGGNGGNGGIGVTGSGVTINNSGTITGGAGGIAGTGGSNNGTAGPAGSGVSGSDLTIVNSGAISGGLAGDGVTRADAITFGSGASSLTTNAGGSYTGAISVAGGGSLTLLQTAAGRATGSFVYSTSFSGAGALIVTTDSGYAVTLSGANTYSGGTTVTGGKLQLSAGGTLGATSGTTTVSGGTLDLGSTTQTQSAFSLAGGTVQNGNLNTAITSTGGTVNSLGGTASLTTTSGTTIVTGINTYSGATTVNGGVLDVVGTISDPTVNAGGTLMGSGTVAATQVNAGGIFAPGNGTAGTSMTIAGNLAFQSGAIYFIEVNPSTASFATVTGKATLNGATVNAVFANGSYVSKTYTILTATGGVSGTFASGVVNTNLPTNFSTSLSYDANNAFLDLTLSYAPGAPNFGSGLNGNQQAVANALVNFFNANGGIPLAYGALNGAGLTQASGELGTSSQQTTFNAMGQFMGLLTDPFMQRSGGAGLTSGAAGFADEEDATAYAARKRTDAFAMFTKAPPPVPFVQRWSVWAAGFGGSQSTDGNAVTGSNNTTSSIYGTAVGADYLFSPNTLAGFALAGGGTSFSVNGLDSGRSDLFQAGAYVRHISGPAYVSAALAYGWQDITTNRVVTAAGIDHLRAEFKANAWSGRMEGGYRFVAPVGGGIGLTPYAAAQFTTFDLPAYAEQAISGASAFALSYGTHSPTDTRTEIGLRSDKSFALDSAVLTLRGRLAWAHDYDPGRAIAATFQALPGASFVVDGAAQAADSALTTASAELKWTNGLSAQATFEGEFSGVTRSYAGKGVVRYAW
jgi:uncharacterized protein with beta-barrel porin domain